MVAYYAAQLIIEVFVVDRECMLANRWKTSKRRSRIQTG
jgi:hypothetical protein